MGLAKVERVGVVGAGQMGRGIAELLARTGLPVTLGDASLELAAAAKLEIARGLEKLVRKGQLEGGEQTAILARISPAASVASMVGSDVVIEAVSENMALKTDIFRDLDRVVDTNAVLATNTSSISITRIASETSRPGRVIGMHFMNPAPRMPLVEIVRGLLTSDRTFECVKGLATALGKTVITSRDTPGFIVNRILIPFLNEACFALQEGVGIAEDVDTGARLGLNHPMGPFELADLIGLDTVLAIADVMQRETGDPKYRAATLLRNLVAAGHLGRKSGRGFYEYDEAGRRTRPQKAISAEE